MSPRLRLLRGAFPAAMTIEVSSPALADSLCEALIAMGCTAIRREDRCVDVVAGWPLREAGSRHLDSYLHAWEIRSAGRAVRVNSEVSLI
jgi:hypothetical protein